MHPEGGPGYRLDFSRFPEDSMRLAIDLGRRILGPFAPIAPLFRRLLYISDAPPLNLARAPRIPPEGGSGDRMDFSRSPEDPMRSAVDPGRLILGPCAPLAHRCRRLSHIPDAPHGDRPLAPRKHPRTESGEHRDFWIFREDPMRLAFDLGRWTLGHSPR